METRPTRASRTQWLYFIPVLFFVFGIVFNIIANSQPYVPGGPVTPVGDFFWTGFLVLFGAGILGGIISLGLYLWRAGVAHASRQSSQAQELSNRDLRG
jgi:hypothetical protein